MQAKTTAVRINVHEKMQIMKKAVFNFFFIDIIIRDQSLDNYD